MSKQSLSWDSIFLMIYVAAWRLLGVILLFTEARLVRCAIQWSPVKLESRSG
jgi:hypothetical protein